MFDFENTLVSSTFMSTRNSCNYFLIQCSLGFDSNCQKLCQNWSQTSSKLTQIFLTHSQAGTWTTTSHPPSSVYSSLCKFMKNIRVSPTSLVHRTLNTLPVHCFLHPQEHEALTLFPCIHQQVMSNTESLGLGHDSHKNIPGPCCCCLFSIQTVGSCSV